MTNFWATMLLQTYIIYKNLFLKNFAKYDSYLDLELFRGRIRIRNK
jgi:hypothetical protein